MIGIVTHYGVHNHGAQLQLLALEKELKLKGFEAKALTFIKDYRYMPSGASKKYSISLLSLPFYIKYFCKNGINKTLFNIHKKNIFDKFRKKQVMIGADYTKYSGELLIIGSDEVFSTEVGISDSFWGIKTKAKKVVSYAASFGPTTLDDIQLKKESDFIISALTNFNSISVRDKNSQEIINSLINYNPQIVCDPVILYGYKKEIKNNRIIIKKNYILLYSYDNNMNNPSEIEMIKNVANKMNLPVYSVGFYHKWCDKNINVDPIELIQYFNNAQFIITDTFHGSVISLITESNFAVLVRNNSNKLYYLLEQYNLTNRIFQNEVECFNILNTSINYEKVNEVIDVQKKESSLFLDTILNGIK